MALNIDKNRVGSVLAEIKSNIINQDPQALGEVLSRFVIEGSKTHIIRLEDIKVYLFEDVKEKFEKATPKKEVLYKALLEAGTRFFDSIFFMGMDEARRPEIIAIRQTSEAAKAANASSYYDPTKLSRYIFYTFFYIMIRGHAPSGNAAYAGQPIPKFISSVLGMSETPAVVAAYLASFDLNCLDPNWVRHITIGELGKEAESRFGLGVAGYRICSVFNYYKPDARGAEEYADAIKVAQSFLNAGLDWDFHPATRSADILTKYGNINKNCANLILKVYRPETIEKMVKAKKLYAVPTEDPSHTTYINWSTPFVSKSPIFRKVPE